MDRFIPSPKQIDKAAAEFKAVFGPSHVLEIIHNEYAKFLIRSTAGRYMPRTTLNAIEPPVTRAMLAYARALAAEEYAQLYEEWDLRWSKITPAMPGGHRQGGVFGSYNEVLSEHLMITIIHTSAMTAHEHAADYVRFEHAKYAHLHKRNFPSVRRGVALLTRAYVGSAAKRYGVDVDVGEMTAGMRLGGADRRVIRAARRVLNSVHRQRIRGSLVDVVDATRALDGAFARLGTQYAGA